MPINFYHDGVLLVQRGSQGDFPIPRYQGGSDDPPIPTLHGSDVSPRRVKVNLGQCNNRAGCLSDLENLENRLGDLENLENRLGDLENLENLEKPVEKHLKTLKNDSFTPKIL